MTLENVVHFSLGSGLEFLSSEGHKIFLFPLNLARLLSSFKLCQIWLTRNKMNMYYGATKAFGPQLHNISQTGKKRAHEKNLGCTTLNNGKKLFLRDNTMALAFFRSWKKGNFETFSHMYVRRIRKEIFVDDHSIATSSILLIVQDHVTRYGRLETWLRAKRLGHQLPV